MTDSTLLDSSKPPYRMVTFPPEAADAAQELRGKYLPSAFSSVAVHYVACWIARHVEQQAQQTDGPPKFCNWHLALELLLLEIAGIAEASSASG